MRHYWRSKEKGAWIRLRYGLTKEGYNQLLDAQGAVCAICGQTPQYGTRYKKLGVDHDHTTRQVRGLLCGMCNRGIGAFGDDPARLRSAADYLERCNALNKSEPE